MSRSCATRGRDDVAAIAESADLTVLHVDNDFELITEITGQPLERLDAA